MAGIKAGFYWHVHHDMLCEWSDDIQERIDYIKAEKPTGEIETRLRLLKPVQGKLPAAYGEARAAYDKARAAYDKARAARDKARAAYESDILALHAIECPGCPWQNGTIFPGHEVM